MKRHSLRFRLLSAAAISILVTLILAGLGLVTLFEWHVERRLEAELETNLRQLIGFMEVDDQQRIHITGKLADPRFEEPLSGLYWQIQNDEHHILLRSMSLWDQMIELPLDKLAPGIVHKHNLPGPNDQQLLVRERQVILLPHSLAYRLRVVVAIDQHELKIARNAFAADLFPYLGLLAIVLIAGFGLQVQTGLSPLQRIHRGVQAVRSGQRQRLEQAYPDEIRPLVDEINDLLDARDQSIERARAWTADLAHGLKTPLTVLRADAQRLRKQGNEQIADDLDHLVDAMHRRVDRELIRARLRSAGSGGHGQTDVVTVISGVVKTLQRTPAGENCDWQLSLPGSALADIQRDDLAELMGNLLENASKWAKGKIRIRVTTGDGGIDILIEDDGPGVEAEQLSSLGQRGLRLDQQQSGSGLGLAIASDIVEAYQGTLEFSTAGIGGLAVHIRLAASGMPSSTEA